MPLVKVFLLSNISAYEYIPAWMYILYDYTFPSNEIIIKKYIHNCMILSFKHFSEEFSYKVEKYSVTCVQRMKCWWNTVVRSHYFTKTWCSGLTQPFLFKWLSRKWAVLYMYISLRFLIGFRLFGQGGILFFILLLHDDEYGVIVWLFWLLHDDEYEVIVLLFWLLHDDEYEVIV